MNSQVMVIFIFDVIFNDQNWNLVFFSQILRFQRLILDLFSDLLQNIYANNVKVDSIDAISAGQSALPKVTALMSKFL